MEWLAGCQATGHLLSRSISILLKTPGDKRGSELTEQAGQGQAVGTFFIPALIFLNKLIFFELKHLFI